MRSGCLNYIKKLRFQTHLLFQIFALAICSFSACSFSSICLELRKLKLRCRPDKMIGENKNRKNGLSSYVNNIVTKNDYIFLCIFMNAKIGIFIVLHVRSCEKVHARTHARALFQAGSVTFYRTKAAVTATIFLLYIDSVHSHILQVVDLMRCVHFKKCAIACDKTGNYGCRTRCGREQRIADKKRWQMRKRDKISVLSTFELIRCVCVCTECKCLDSDAPLCWWRWCSPYLPYFSFHIFFFHLTLINNIIISISSTFFSISFSFKKFSLVERSFNLNRSVFFSLFSLPFSSLWKILRKE